MATDVETLIVTLEATTKQYERKLAQAQGTTVAIMRKLQETITQAGSGIEARMAHAGERAGRAFAERLGESAREVGRGFIATIIGSFGIERIKEVFQQMNEIREFSENVGISTDAVQTFGAAMRLAGGDSETMNKAIESMVAQLADNKSALSEFLKAQGIDTATKSTEELVKIFFDFTRGMSDAGEKIRLLKEVTGLKPAGVLQLIDALNNMDRAAKATRFTREELETAHNVVEALNNAIVEAEIAFGKFLADSINVASVDDALHQVVEAFKEILAAVGEVIGAWQRLKGLIKDVFPPEVLAVLQKLGPQSAAQQIAARQAHVNDLIAQRNKLLQDQAAGQTTIARGFGKGMVEQPIQSEIDRLTGEIEMWKATYQTTEEHLGELLDARKKKIDEVAAAEAKAAQVQDDMLHGKADLQAYNDALNSVAALKAELAKLNAEIDKSNNKLLKMADAFNDSAARARRGIGVSRGENRYKIPDKEDQAAAKRADDAVRAEEEKLAVQKLEAAGQREAAARLDAENDARNSGLKEGTDLYRRFIAARMQEFALAEKSKQLAEATRDDIADLGRQKQIAEALGNEDAVARLEAEIALRQKNLTLKTEEGRAEYQRAYLQAKADQATKKTLDSIHAEQQDIQELGGMLESATSQFVDGLVEGQKATEALHNALKSLANDLLHWALHKIFQELFPDQPGQGIFGNLLGGPAMKAQPSPASTVSTASQAALKAVGDVLSGGGGTNIGGLVGGITVPATDSEVGAYIAQAARARGINPAVALKVWSGEGRGAWQSNLYGGALGLREPSYGPFQMLKGGPGTGYGKGMGNLFEQQTGLDVTDPAMWKQHVDFALDQARKVGWSPWYGARAQGITGRMGIDDAAKKIDASAANLETGTDGLTHSVDNLSSTMGGDVSTQIQQAGDMLAKSAPQLGKMFSKLLDSMGDLVTNLASGMPNLLSSMNLGMAPAASIGSFFEHSFPMFQHGGEFKVGGAGGTDSSLVAFKATPGEMVKITPRHLAGTRGSNALSYHANTAIHIDGSADEKTVDMIDRRIAANNYRQRKALERDWGAMSMRYQQLRG